jgi:hypothetical protein
MAARISVDFNSRLAEDRIIIPLTTAEADSGRYHVGDLVKLYDDELEVQARLEYFSDHRWWIGVTDWSTKHFIS